MRGISQIEQDLALPKTPFKGLIPAVIDSGEQNPFDLDATKFTTEVKPLAAGDYSISGFEGEFACERKNSLGEYISWITSGRERYYHEITLLSKIPVAFVLIEQGTLDQIMRGEFNNLATPQSVIGTIVSSLWRFKVPVYFAGSRRNAQKILEIAMIQFCSKLVEKAKKIKGLINER